ncbi:RNA exonuclease 4 [Takifugu flavidus]|uniref:RNA exonuclease 4 n=1 Tax=Takifugu flavidus TaxID=433684 RepID=A0A5C6PRL5_9TELE|nr:RNA exonuclease 4 [Takifugu flavidus]TWW81361.1 RNA exonuclease 4 [Takifugu flavidus]
MSKINTKSNYAVNAQQPNSPKVSTAKMKKKEWMTNKYRKKKILPKEKEKPKPLKTLLPTDSQQFSANWKALQEMLKVHQVEKKQTVLPKHHNGSLPVVKVKEDASKSLSKKTKTGLTQKGAGTQVKGKTVSPTGGPRDSHSKVPNASDKRHSTVPKKRWHSGESNYEPKFKMKKTVVEKEKLTEDDLWFDDVDPDDIEAAIGAEAAEMMRKKQGIKKDDKNPETALVKEKAFDGLTRVVAIDCEMVGVGPDGEDSILARVSLVNQFGKCIYDKHVKPTEKVTDYRTAVSGIRPKDIKNGEEVKIVQREVAEILKGRIVVGHAIHNDLKILLLDHPKKKIRDTQKYKPFRKTVKSSRPSLKLLCREILNVKVQQGEHSSVQDAQATMRLYTMVKKQWEAEIKAKKSKGSEETNERRPRCPVSKGRKSTGK